MKSYNKTGIDKCIFVPFFLRFRQQNIQQQRFVEFYRIQMKEEKKNIHITIFRNYAIFNCKISRFVRHITWLRQRHATHKIHYNLIYKYAMQKRIHVSLQNLCVFFFSFNLSRFLFLSFSFAFTFIIVVVVVVVDYNVVHAFFFLSSSEIIRTLFISNFNWINDYIFS